MPDMPPVPADQFEVGHNRSVPGFSAITSLTVLPGMADGGADAVVMLRSRVDAGHFDEPGHGITSNTEIILPDADLRRLATYLAEIVAHRDAVEASKPIYRARFLSVRATGDHRLGIERGPGDTVITDNAGHRLGSIPLILLQRAGYTVVGTSEHDDHDDPSFHYLVRESRR